MDTKPSITYIKNGKEKTIKINIANKNIVLNRLFDKKVHMHRFFRFVLIYEYKFKKDIDKIIFKNFTFKEDKLLLFNQNNNLNQIIHLENCTFNSRVQIEFKNVEIINHQTNEDNIKIDNCDYAYIDVSKTDKDTSLIVEECKNLELISGDNLKRLTISSKNASIKNLSPINNSILFIDNNLTLQDSIYEATMITTKRLNLINSRISNEQNLTLNCKIINLVDSVIKSKDSLYINNLSKIEFNDIIDDTILDTSSYIEAENKIYIENNIYLSNKKEKIVLSKEELEEFIQQYENKESEELKQNYSIKENSTSKFKKLVFKK